MEYKFSNWELDNLHRLFSNISITGQGIRLAEIDRALKIKNKMEVVGITEANQDEDKEIEFTPDEIKMISDKAFQAQGWPVHERTLQLKQRLQQYVQQSKNGEE